MKQMSHSTQATITSAALLTVYLPRLRTLLANRPWTIDASGEVSVCVYAGACVIYSDAGNIQDLDFLDNLKNILK